MNESVKYFFNRSFEVLHRRTFDSYRLMLNNPYIIFEELHVSLEKYKKKKIKHFDPTITEIGVECIELINSNHLKDLIKFDPFSKSQILELLNNSCIKQKNDNRIRSLMLMAKSVISQNKDFKGTIINRLKLLLNNHDETNWQEINALTGWLYSQLVFMGFSRYFIELRLRKCGDLIFKGGKTIDDAFDEFNKWFSNKEEEYSVYFKVKKNPAQKLKFTSSLISEKTKLLKVLEDSPHLSTKFKEKDSDETFLQLKIESHDFWAAIHQAYQIVSESLEINALHNSDNKLLIESQAVAVHNKSNKFRADTIIQTIDGFYEHNEKEFERFVSNLKKIDSSTAKEKILSAIRFYKLGTEAVELEHKILNYWIGFEQLFSAVDSKEDSINRMKTFFTSLNLSYYFQRRVSYLIAALKRNNITYKGKEIDQSIFKLTDFDSSLLSGKNPLLMNRLIMYFEFNKDKEIRKYIEVHNKRLNQHLTRIYRVRNELVHEGKTTLQLNLIVGHLRHYLLFSIEQITNEISENENVEIMDDALVYYENLMERIRNCKNLSEILSIRNYKGYME